MRYVFLLSLMITSIAFGKTYKVDTKKSSIQWVGKKLAGSQHEGTVMFKSGTVDYTKGVLKSVKVTADMKSIKNNDVKEKKWRDKLENHLKDKDFFDVSKFPEAHFSLKSVSGKGKKLKVKGSLTIKGQSHPVAFDVDVVKSTDKEVVAKAKLSIDRTKWGVKYNSTSFFDMKALGDKAIHDMIELQLHIVAKS